MNFDLHSHFFPLEAFQKATKFREQAPRITQANGRYSVSAGAGTRGNLTEGAYNIDARVKELDRMGIDMQALSPSPILLFYGASPDAAVYFSRLQNEAIKAVVEARPDRFVGFGTAPLQSVFDAIAVAGEAKNLGLKGLEIGTHVQGKPLDHPDLEPFYQTAERLGLLLFVHPIEGGGEGGDPVAAELGNVLSFPYQTTLMVERMILKGLFEKYRHLRLCLAHGGGLLAYNIWRLDHAYAQRSALRENVPHKPSSYLKQLYFDSILHSAMALDFLIQVVGADRVVIGTDYPMGMGDKNPVATIMALKSVNEAERTQILETNAMKALGMEDPATPRTKS